MICVAAAEVMMSEHPDKSTPPNPPHSLFGIGWSANDFFHFGRAWIPGLLQWPVETNHKVRSDPTLTRKICWITLIVYFTLPAEIAVNLALKGNDGFRFGGLNFLSYWFVHGSLYHLASNLYCLWIFGDNLEEDIGKKKYVALLGLGTVLGGLLQYTFTPNGEFYLGGASGGISALIGYYALRYPWVSIAHLFAFIWIRVPSFIFALWWVFIQWVTLKSQLLGETKISALAHLGGVAASLLAWVLWRWK